MRREGEDFEVEVDDRGEFDNRDDMGTLGVEGAVDEGGDIEARGRVLARIVVGGCDKAPLRSEEWSDVVTVTGCADERIEKAVEHLFRTWDVEGNDGSCMSSSAVSVSVLKDDECSPDCVLARRSGTRERVLDGSVTPASVCCRNVEVLVVVCC